VNYVFTAGACIIAITREIIIFVVMIKTKNCIVTVFIAVIVDEQRVTSIAPIAILAITPTLVTIRTISISHGTITYNNSHDIDREPILVAVFEVLVRCI